MDARRLIRGIARWTLLDQILDFAYWIAVVVGLVLLGQRFEARPVMLGVVCVGYAAVAILLYFTVVRGLRRFFREDEPSS